MPGFLCMADLDFDYGKAVEMAGEADAVWDGHLALAL